MMYAVVKVTDKIVRNIKFPYKKQIVSQKEIVEFLEDGNEAFKKALQITNDFRMDPHIDGFVQRVYGLSMSCQNKDENENNNEETNESEKIIFPHEDSDIEDIFKSLTENDYDYNNSPVIVKRFIKEEFYKSMKWAWDKYLNCVPTASKSFKYSDIDYMGIVRALFNLAQNVYTAEISSGCDEWFNIYPRRNKEGE